MDPSGASPSSLGSVSERWARLRPDDEGDDAPPDCSLVPAPAPAVTEEWGREGGWEAAVNAGRDAGTAPCASMRTRSSKITAEAGSAGPALMLASAVSERRDADRPKSGETRGGGCGA